MGGKKICRLDVSGEVRSDKLLVLAAGLELKESGISELGGGLRWTYHDSAFAPTTIPVS